MECVDGNVRAISPSIPGVGTGGLPGSESMFMNATHQSDVRVKLINNLVWPFK